MAVPGIVVGGDGRSRCGAKRSTRYRSGAPSQFVTDKGTKPSANSTTDGRFNTLVIRHRWWTGKGHEHGNTHHTSFHRLCSMRIHLFL